MIINFLILFLYIYIYIYHNFSFCQWSGFKIPFHPMTYFEWLFNLSSRNKFSFFFFFHHYCSLSFISSTSNEFFSKKKKKKKRKKKKKKKFQWVPLMWGNTRHLPFFSKLMSESKMISLHVLEILSMISRLKSDPHHFSSSWTWELNVLFI